MNYHLPDFFTYKQTKILILFLVVSIILFSRFYPVYHAYKNTPQGYVYSGQTSMYDSDDINVYVAAIRYGQHGNITLKNQYTTLEANEALIYPFYTVIGNLFKEIDPYILYHSATALLIILISICLYFLSLKILHNFFLSILSLFLVMRGGGFGWLCVKIFGDSIPAADIFYSNITFTSALAKAHDGLGTLFLILSLTSFYFFLLEKRRKFALLSGISLNVLMVFYPYYILSYVGVIGVYSAYYVLKHKTYWFLPMLISIILTSGFVLILLFVNIQQSGFSMVIGEQITKLSLPSFLFGYGVFILLLATLFMIEPSEFKKENLSFFICWIIVSIVLSYTPIGYSRFFLRGLYFPFVILSLMMIRTIKSEILKKILLLCFIILMPLTSLLIFSIRIRMANEKDPWQYISSETNEVFTYLKNAPEGGVLASYRLSNFVPAKTNQSVYLGHSFQTPNSYVKTNEVIDFYSGKMTNDAAKNFLSTNNITYVIYGREERSLGGHLYPFLQLRVDGSITKLYSL